MGNIITTSIGNTFRSIGSWIGGSESVVGNNSGAQTLPQNVGSTSMRIPLQRIVQTIGNWKTSIDEAEYYIPHRVKMQQLYNTLIDEPHVAAAMSRRFDLTLLRDFEVFCGNDRETEIWTEYLKNASWFNDYQRMGLTALARGYSLVSLGNIVSNESMINALPEIKMLEHSQISPDRLNFVPVVYQTIGVNFTEPPYREWHVWFTTTPEIGNGACGYGFLNKCAMPAILLRANLTDNANYNEKFGMPVVWGKTSKDDTAQSTDRTDFFNQLRSMGSASTFVTDLTDELEFLESKSGQGYKTYADLETRCQKLISKVILGHADVLDSIPKRSGSAEGNSQTPTTPVAAALADIQGKDGKYMTPYNNQLIRLLRFHGVPLPKSATFRYKNDDEEEQADLRRYERIQSFATIAKTAKDAGIQISPEVFETETGLKCEAIEIPKPTLPKQTETLSKEVKNKLELLYKIHKH